MFRPGKGESVELRLDPEEAKLVENLLGELRALIEAPELLGDDVVARLQPDAHPDDRLAEEEFRDLALDDIRRQRFDAVDSISRALEENRKRRGSVAATLDADAVEAWMISLNHLRLAIGTALDIEQDKQVPTDLDLESTEAQRYAVYSWLSLAMDMLVDAAADIVE